MTIDIRQAHRLLRSKDLTVRRLVDEHLDRIEQHDPEVRANLVVLADEARDRADLLDAALATTMPSSELFGIPIAVKDNIDLAGLPTTVGSAGITASVAERDATVVALLRAAGAVFVSKANLDELAFGGESSNPLLTTRNPWNLDAVPGGSSGGSAAAVAAGMCMAALGTDTGGSVRNPSGWCGVVGFKPTYGVVDTAGVQPLAPSLDTVGFLARTVDDCRALLAATANPTWKAYAPTAPLGDDRRPRIAVATNLVDEVEPGVRDTFAAAVDALSDSVDLEDVPLAGLEAAMEAIHTIMVAEAAAAWRDLLVDESSGLGDGVRQALGVGLSITPDRLRSANVVRQELASAVRDRYGSYDAVIHPTMGFDPRPDVFGDDAVASDSPIWRHATRYACMWNLTGAPVVSVPCGFAPSGHPVAMQVVGAPDHDWLTLDVAGLLERTWAIPRTSLVPPLLRTPAASDDDAQKETA